MSYSAARRSKHAFRQLSLFSVKIRSAVLVAWASPRRAFYRIWIESADGEFSVVKESGTIGKQKRVLDKRSWECDSLDAAEKLFEQRIKAKTNPLRKSPRVYKLVSRTGSRELK